MEKAVPELSNNFNLTHIQFSEKEGKQNSTIDKEIMAKFSISNENYKNTQSRSSMKPSVGNHEGKAPKPSQVNCSSLKARRRKE